MRRSALTRLVLGGLLAGLHRLQRRGQAQMRRERGQVRLAQLCERLVHLQQPEHDLTQM